MTPVKETKEDLILKAKLDAINELLALHYKKRENISSSCKSLIDIVTVEEYKESLK